MRRFLEREDPSWRTLLADLRQRCGEVDGSRAFVEILFLCRTHGALAVTEAVRKAVQHPDVSIAAVRFFLRDDAETASSRPTAMPYSGPAVHQGSPADYADLATTAEVCHA